MRRPRGCPPKKTRLDNEIACQNGNGMNGLFDNSYSVTVGNANRLCFSPSLARPDSCSSEKGKYRFWSMYLGQPFKFQFCQWLVISLFFICMCNLTHYLWILDLVMNINILLLFIVCEADSGSTSSSRLQSHNGSTICGVAGIICVFVQSILCTSIIR